MIAPDQIGFCKSSKPAAYQFTFKQLAGNTHELLTKLGIEKPVVIGHSTGGMLAAHYSLIYPQDVSQLVLVNPIGLEDFIATIEQVVGRQAIRRDLPMQPGDVPATWASTAKLEQLTGFKPATPLAQGVRDFVTWYRGYYRV